MHTSRRFALATALCALVAGPAAVRAGLENGFLIAGKTLLIKDNANAAKRKAVFVSKDAVISFAANGDKPTNVGMTVRFASPCATSSVFFLPTTGWSEKKGKFKYKGDRSGPVKTIVAKAGFVKLVAKGAQLDFPLIGTGPQGSVTVSVESQETAWTAFFGPDNATISATTFSMSRVRTVFFCLPSLRKDGAGVEASQAKWGLYRS